MAETNKTAFDYASEIWNIADYLRDVIKRSEYNRVILPFALLRRLECALEPTRQDVLNALAEHESDWGREHDNYCQFSGKSFFNVTNFRLNTLGATDTLEALMAYINGFSPNAREILLRFKLKETCETLQEHEMLYEVCRRFSAFDLSPENVSDREMSHIYEHLIQKFGEEIAEDAEDFMTPKDVVRLAVSMIFANDDELMNSDTGIVRTLYDATCGTGGFITDALDQLDEWHSDKKMKAPALIVPYGQEIEDESWAICKANLLLRNIDTEDNDVYDQIKDMSAHILRGDTLANDMFEGTKFNYQLNNPPYGKKWEKSQKAVLDEAKLGFKGRFGAGIPKIDDGSMLFLQHVANKMLPPEEGGGKAGIVLSGSPLFQGEAGKGSSNIRRWLFVEDLIDCIIKLPEQIFFRTGINTYLWILSNIKPANRKGMVQLIDASELWTSIPKNLGKKRREISSDQIREIVSMYIDGVVNEKSVIVPYSDFEYRKVTTQQPLHAILRLNKDNIDTVLQHNSLNKLSAENKAILNEYLNKKAGQDEVQAYDLADAMAKEVRKLMEKPGIPATNIQKAIIDACAVKGSEYPIVYDKKNNVVPDGDLTDSENIPFSVPFEEYMNKEVLPYAPEAWIDESVKDEGPLQDGGVGIVGTNISFNKYFYHYEEPRKPEEIAAEISTLEDELKSFMKEVFQ